MRTVEEERMRYTWLTPSQAAREIGADQTGAKDGGAEYVRSLIRDGKLGEPGEVMDIGRRGRPIYLVHPKAVERFRRESVERYQRSLEERESEED